jgi:hypothetical protein
MEIETKHTITGATFKFITLFLVSFHFNTYDRVSVTDRKWLFVWTKSNRLNVCAYYFVDVYVCMYVFLRVLYMYV